MKDKIYCEVVDAMDYFYEQEAELFTFYRIPKELFTNPKYKHTSAEAKVLYGLLLDRNSISRKNGWVDTQRRVFIQYSREEAMEKLGCGHNPIVKLFKELNEIGLIEEVRQGLGKTNIIYVKKFAQMYQGGVAPEKVEQSNSSRSQEIGDQDFRKAELQNSEKRNSRTPKNGTPELRKTELQNSEKQ